MPLGAKKDVPGAEDVRSHDVSRRPACVMGDRACVNHRVASGDRLEYRCFVAEVVAECKVKGSDDAALGPQARGKTSPDLP